MSVHVLSRFRALTGAEAERRRIKEEQRRLRAEQRRLNDEALSEVLSNESKCLLLYSFSQGTEML